MAVTPRFLLAALLAVLAGASSAGPWNRAEGEGFASLTTRYSWSQDLATWTSRAPVGQYHSVYLEYGLTPHLTLGLDLGRSVSGATKTVAFLQWPLRADAGRLVVAAELGLGRIDGESVLRPGLSMGMGFDRGWVALDGVTELDLGVGSVDLKLDLTLGRNLKRGRKLIVQLQSGRESGDAPFLRLEPSFVIPLGERMHFESGGVWGLVEDGSFGVKLGVWMTF